MKNVIRALIVSVCCFSSFAAIASEIPVGTFSQTSSTSAGPDCPNCEIKISKIADNQIQLISNNDWTGSAVYDKASDKYTGSMKWLSGKGGAYENTVFAIQLTYEGNTLNMSFASPKLNFKNTYREKK